MLFLKLGDHSPLVFGGELRSPIGQKLSELTTMEIVCGEIVETGIPLALFL